MLIVKLRNTSFFFLIIIFFLIYVMDIYYKNGKKYNVYFVRKKLYLKYVYIYIISIFIEI